MAQKKKSVPLTPGQLDKLNRSQAEERVRRGFHSFTRNAVREAVMGKTDAENTMHRYHRRSQVTGRKPAK